MTKKEDECFLLTDREFAEAVIAWENKKAYYCMRLECYLPKNVKFARTPKEDLDYEVFILVDKKTGGEQKIFKKNGRFLRTIFDGYSERKVDAMLNEEELSQLINQEEFYTQKKYLLLN